MRVSILPLGQGMASTTVGPLEIFRNAGLLWGDLTGEPTKATFDVQTVSPDGLPITFEGGLTLQPDKALSQVRKTDLILVPGIGTEVESVVNGNRKTIDWIKRRAARGVAVAGICSGVAILAEAGLLDGQIATTHWGLTDAYRQRYPNVEWQTERFITENDNVFCGGGIYAALDMSLYLVEKFAGYETAMHCSRALLIEPRRAWQSEYCPATLKQDHTDEKIQAIQRYMIEHCHEDIGVDQMARRASISPRPFARRFKNATGHPLLTYLHQLRVAKAKRLLEIDSKSVQEVCREVGYSDIAFFRNVFKRHTGVPPKTYRQRFGRGTDPAHQSTRQPVRC
jgi:transcriptional regulator GlxA family with amidase domain